MLSVRYIWMEFGCNLTLFSSSLKLVIDTEAFMQSTGTNSADAVIRANIFECLALSLGRNKSDAPLLQNRWGKPTVEFSEYQKFEDLFGQALTVWRLKTLPSRYVYGELVFGSGREPSPFNISIGNGWNAESEQITVNDDISWIADVGILHFFPCEFTNDCDFVCHEERKMQDHIAAHNADRIHCVETVIGDDIYLREEMIAEGVLPHGFRVGHFVTWDIESILSPSELGKTHVPFSIGATKNFGTKRKWFVSRTDSSAESLREMISSFIDFLEHAGVEYNEALPDSIQDNLRTLYIRLKRHREGINTMDPKELSKVQNYVRELKAIQLLPIYSFRGERYDVPVLKGALFNELFERDPEFSTIKRGSGVMQIMANNMIFKDAGPVT